MLQTQTVNLPPDQQRRLHPEFLANEQAYLQMRDSLVAQYCGQWVAVHGGRVIAAGPELMEVMDRATAAAVTPTWPSLERRTRWSFGCGESSSLMTKSINRFP